MTSIKRIEKLQMIRCDDMIKIKVIKWKNMEFAILLNVIPIKWLASKAT
jgi:hypothetical protein